MLTRRSLLLVVGVVVLVAGCYPRRLPSSCVQRVNECLRRCAARDDSGDAVRHSTADFGVDNRSECERACHDLCAGWEPGKADSRSPMPDPDDVLK